MLEADKHLKHQLTKVRKAVESRPIEGGTEPRFRHIDSSLSAQYREGGDTVTEVYPGTGWPSMIGGLDGLPIDSPNIVLIEDSPVGKAASFLGRGLSVIIQTTGNHGDGRDLMTFGVPSGQSRPYAIDMSLSAPGQVILNPLSDNAALRVVRRALTAVRQSPQNFKPRG